MSHHDHASPPDRPVDRQQALDILIEVGLLLGCRLELAPCGAGYDARLPVEQLGRLALLCHRVVDEANDLHAINADLRRQRDHARRVALALRFPALLAD